MEPRIKPTEKGISYNYLVDLLFIGNLEHNE